MSLLSLFGYGRPPAVETLAPNSSDDFWYGPVAGLRTVAGVRVDEMIAMTYSACWAATMLLASSESMIPLKLFRRLPGGGSEPATDDPRYALVHDSPNPDMTSFMFRASRTAQQINFGQGYAEIGRTQGGVAVALYPIHASRIPKESNIKRGVDGRLRYLVNNENGTKREVLDTDILHIPSPVSEDGIIGLGVVEKARLSIAMGLATETQGAAYFGNSARPKLVIEGTTFKTKEDKDEFLRQWMQAHGSPENNARPALAPPGSKVVPLQFSAEDSQFLETRQFNVEEIARWYGVPPHMIQNLLRSTNNNITQQALEFVKYSLMRWLVPWEQELNKKLLTATERRTMYFKHIVEGLERADITTRTEALHQQWFDGATTLNEWRGLEDRNPIGPLGDIHWTQQAMVPLEIAAKGPQDESLPQPDKEKEGATEGDSELTAVLQEIAALRSQVAAIPHGLNGDAVVIKEQLASARSVQWQLAAAMLGDVMSRMVSLEVNAVKRVAEKPSRFDARLREFYTRHEDTLARSLEGPVAACLAAKGERRITAEVVRTVVSRHINESLRQLDALCDCTADQLEGRVEECVSRWHERTISL